MDNESAVLEALRKAKEVISLAARKKGKQRKQQLADHKAQQAEHKDISSQIDHAMRVGMDEHGNVPEPTKPKKPNLKLVKEDKYTTSLASAKLKPKAPSSKLDYSPQSKTSVGRENMRPASKPNIHTEKPASTIGNNDKLTTGTRITYGDRSKARTGAQIYNDPETWKSLPDDNYGGLIKTDENGQWSLDKADENPNTAATRDAIASNQPSEATNAVEGQEDNLV